MIHITVDPGVSGALAVMFEDGKTTAYNYPGTTKETVEILKDLVQHEIQVTAIIEKVHSMSGNGIKSTWTFAENFSMWKTAMTVLDIPFKLVSPQAWMKAVGDLPKDKSLRKKRLKEYSQQLYPHLKVTLKNADALAMMAVFDKVW